MINEILSTLDIMGWLGIVLMILVSVNISTKTMSNIWSGVESFSWKKMLKGFCRALVFYVSAVATSVAFTMLPLINDMMIAKTGIMLVSTEVLETLSATGIIAVVVATIIKQGKSAMEGIVCLSYTDTNDKTIDNEETNEEANEEE